MKLLCDENIECSLVSYLRESGFDVTYISEDSRGIRDEEVLLQAQHENRVLITADLDFGTLVYQQAKTHAGVIILRLAQLSLADKEKIVEQLLRTHEDKLPGAFAVVTIDSIRIRQFETHSQCSRQCGG